MFRPPTALANLLRWAGAGECGRSLSWLDSKELRAIQDRNAQFEHINEQALRFGRRGQPVVSVDTKKKELVGDFKNGGREWRRRGEPEEVRVHDSLDKNAGQGDSLRRVRRGAP